MVEWVGETICLDIKAFGPLYGRK